MISIFVLVMRFRTLGLPRSPSADLLPVFLQRNYESVISRPRVNVSEEYGSTFKFHVSAVGRQMTCQRGTITCISLAAILWYNI